MSSRTRHDIIQNTAKEKKQTKVISGFDNGTKILQGVELQDYLFQEAAKKFNPLGPGS